MTEKPDPIRILLLDDSPSDLWDVDNIRVPGIRTKHGGDYFEVLWMATAGEAREYRDLSRHIALHSPQLLGELGTVPELLVVDYSLTSGGGDKQPVHQQLVDDADLMHQASPIPRLRDAAKRHKIALNRDRYEFDGTLQEDESFGCIMGGLLYTTFSDHPCSVIASTFREDVHNSYPGFFEWALHDESSGALAAGEKHEGWQSLLSAGMPRLRARICRLATAGIVQVSLDDLLALAEDSTHPVLTISSRYGQRRYPVAGLFIDGQVDPSRWAEELLRDAWWRASDGQSDQSFEQGLASLRTGIDVCRKLWSAYDDEQMSEHFARRLRLSELCHTANSDSDALDDAMRDELQELMAEFGVSAPNDERTGCTKGTWDIRECGTDDPAALRWAVLFCILRLLHLRYRAVQEANLSDSSLKDGNKRFGFTIEKPVDVDDVYLLLFPIPKTPLVLPYHNRDPKKKGVWQSEMVRMKVKLKDLLKGQGLRPGERRLLRWYAESLGYNWRDDGGEQAKAILGSAVEERIAR